MQLVSKITSHEKVMASSPAINRPILFYSREPIFLCSMQNVKCVDNFPVVSVDKKKHCERGRNCKYQQSTKVEGNQSKSGWLILPSSSGISKITELLRALSLVDSCV